VIFFSDIGREPLLFAFPFVTHHIILVVFFLENITKSVTQLYYYSKQ